MIAVFPAEIAAVSGDNVIITGRKALGVFLPESEGCAERTCGTFSGTVLTFL